MGDFTFLKSLTGSGGTANAVIDDSKFTTSDNIICPIIKFTFSDITIGTQGLSLYGCSSPDNSIPCRTIITQTDSTRITGGSPSELTYQYIIEANGGATLVINGII